MLFPLFRDEDVMNKKVFSYRFDDVRVDLPRFEVHKDGAPVKIEPKAYEVLLHLIENRERVVEKGELLDAVWKNCFVTENALTRVVAQLRKGLGDAKTSRYIATVHKRGYRFVADVVEESEEPKAEHATPQGSQRPSTGLRAVTLPGVEEALAVGVVVVGATCHTLPGRIPTVGSVAVIPLRDLGADSDTEYLGDGLTTALANALSRLPQLAVSARSTVIHYTGPEVDPSVVGHELDVDAVLVCRVRADGVVGVDLVDGRDGRRLWSGRYGIERSDLTTIEQRIASDVTDAVHLRLTERDRQALSRGRTDNPGAYEAYLLGRCHWNAQRVDELRASIEHFERSIAEDREYAPAYAGLADAYTMLGTSGFVRPDEAFSNARRAALARISHHRS
jgi:DNA-binding winged helix-turn-helix (wHTH) protein/TolB-like protein